MTLAGASSAFKSSTLISWKSTGKLQQTIAKCIEKTGRSLHSGQLSTVRIWPELAGVGRYFDFDSNFIHASIDFAQHSPLSTTLSKDGHTVRTVEHLLSALEATSVDNCRIQITNVHGKDRVAEIDEGQHVEDEYMWHRKINFAKNIPTQVPILDGSARDWVEAIEQVGLKVAKDCRGSSREKLAPFLNEPVHVWKNDSFIVAFPLQKVDITYGINFPQVPAIGCQWFSCVSLDDSFYAKQIAPSRTFCFYEDVERMRNAGLIRGGSTENAIVCSASKGWLNPPLRFQDEPSRHKVLDLIGDISLFARGGSQGLPMAHIVAYKGGHALHTDFVRRLLGRN